VAPKKLTFSPGKGRVCGSPGSISYARSCPDSVFYSFASSKSTYDHKTTSGK